MSALTIGFPLPGSGEPIILIGFATPIHEQLEACQHWAGTEVTPVEGVVRIEVWTAQRVVSRMSVPEGAPVDSLYSHLLLASAPADAKCQALETQIRELVEDRDFWQNQAQAMEQSSQHFEKLSGEYSGALEKAILRIQELEAQQQPSQPVEQAKQPELPVVEQELPVVTLPADGGPAKKADKGKKADPAKPE